MPYFFIPYRSYGKPDISYLTCPLLPENRHYIQKGFKGGLLLKMRIGITDRDTEFLNRFGNAMTGRYKDVEILSFPTLKAAKTAADESLLDLLLIDGKTCINHSASIPASCKVAVLTDEKGANSDYSLPAVCRYQSVEEWYTVLCGFCRQSEEALAVRGGAGEPPQDLQGTVCLFISGADGDCALSAAAAFCRFLSEKGFSRLATLEPCFESGEAIWWAAEPLIKRSELVSLCLYDWNYDMVVIPVLNAKQVVLVTDGRKESNEKISKLLHDLPRITGQTKAEILEKTALLYNGFSPQSGELLKNDEVSKLGGLDCERNKKAAFEKLVIRCMRK